MPINGHVLKEKGQLKVIRFIENLKTIIKYYIYL